MPLYTCISLDCREARREPFEIALKKPLICPHCGYDNALRRLALIHFLIRDRQGPIHGDGANYRVACGAENYKHLTGERSAANCPDCLRLAPPEEEVEVPPATPTPESPEESKATIEGR